MQDKLDALGAALPNITSGFVITMQRTWGGALLALVLAIILGLLAGMKNILVRGTARFIIEFFRGTSLVVQLFWAYYVLPILLDIKLDSMLVGILALGVNYVRRLH